MVSLEKLDGINVPNEFWRVYKHHLDQEASLVESAYHELIGTLDRCTNKKNQAINREIKSKVTLKKFTKKAYGYFLKILYVIINNSEITEHISIKSCIKTACEYATAEYLALSIVKSIS